MGDREVCAAANASQTLSAVDKINAAAQAVLKASVSGVGMDEVCNAFNQAENNYGNLTAGRTKKPSL